jgi:hypothetical protein
MEHIAEVLKPIEVVVWGEWAMIYLGAPILYNVRLSLEEISSLSLHSFTPGNR